MNILARPEFPDFKPFSPEQATDPWSVLALARKEQPVFFSPELDAYVVTRYNDVNMVHGDAVTFSNASVISPRSATPADIVREFGNRPLPLEYQVVVSDPPAHTRLRKLIMPAFLPRRVAAREDFIRDYAHRQIDRIESLGSADMIANYAQKIPPAVIGHIVGVPEADAQQFKHWVDGMFVITGEWDADEERLSAAWRGIYAFEDYVQELITERRLRPQDDLTSDYIKASTDDGSPAMSDIEVVQNVINVAAAGSDTTGALITQVIQLLLSHPDQFALVRKDRNLIVNATEEAMRYRGVIRGVVRRTTADVTIAGVAIPKDALVYLSYASANRDETVFPNPDVFDIRRANASRQIAFGSRAHACLGAGLARLEVRVAIETLMDRLPTLALVEPDAPVTFSVNLLLPAMKELQCRW